MADLGTQASACTAAQLSLIKLIAQCQLLCVSVLVAAHWYHETIQQKYLDGMYGIDVHASTAAHCRFVQWFVILKRFHL
jgi:hypothetical protein